MENKQLINETFDHGKGVLQLIPVFVPVVLVRQG